MSLFMVNNICCQIKGLWRRKVNTYKFALPTVVPEKNEERESAWRKSIYQVVISGLEVLLDRSLALCWTFLIVVLKGSVFCYLWLFSPMSV